MYIYFLCFRRRRRRWCEWRERKTINYFVFSPRLVSPVSQSADESATTLKHFRNNEKRTTIIFIQLLEFDIHGSQGAQRISILFVRLQVIRFVRARTWQWIVTCAKKKYSKMFRFWFNNIRLCYRPIHKSFQFLLVCCCSVFFCCK